MAERSPVPSLGELLLRAGVIDAPALERLVTDLRERLRAGRPTSLARLVVERGVPAARILALVGNVEGPSFRCDACSTPYQTGAYALGREFPCARCGALLVGLGRTPSDVDDGRTVRFQGVLRIPEGMPATPAAPATPKALSDSDVAATTLAFGQVLPVPGAVPLTPATAPTVCEEDETGRTMTFKNVLPLPPAAPPATAPRVKPPSDEGGRTMFFEDVLPLPPGQAAPPLTAGWLPPPPPGPSAPPAPGAWLPPPPPAAPWQPPPVQAAWLPGPPAPEPAPGFAPPPPRPSSSPANALPPVPGYASEAITIADPEGNEAPTLPAQKLVAPKADAAAKPKEDVRATASGKAPPKKRSSAGNRTKEGAPGKKRIGPAAIVVLVFLALLATGGVLFALGVFGSK
jgi:hypothetical protein